MQENEINIKIMELENAEEQLKKLKK